MRTDVKILVYSVICGVFVGAVYEIFRLFRLTFFKAEQKKASSQIKQLPKTSDETQILLRSVRVSEYGAGQILTAVCDVLFFLICGIIVSVLIFHTNGGEIRWLSLAGCALGFSLYMFTLGKLVPKLYVKIKDTFIRIFLKIIRILLYPIVKIFKRINAHLRPLRARKKAKRIICYITRQVKKDIRKEEKRKKNIEEDTGETNSDINQDF